MTSGERRVGVEDEEEEVTSEAQQQLKDLLHKQLDTSASSIEGCVKMENYSLGCLIEFIAKFLQFQPEVQQKNFGLE